MLVLAPIVCMVSAVGISHTYSTFFNIIVVENKREKEGETTEELSKKKQRKQKKSEPSPVPKFIAVMIVAGLTLFLILYVRHCTHVTSEAYSSPSIVLHVHGTHGRIVFDDF